MQDMQESLKSSIFINIYNILMCNKLKIYSLTILMKFVKVTHIVFKLMLFWDFSRDIKRILFLEQHLLCWLECSKENICIPVR